MKGIGSSVQKRVKGARGVRKKVKWVRAMNEEGRTKGEERKGRNEERRGGTKGEQGARRTKNEEGRGKGGGADRSCPGGLTEYGFMVLWVYEDHARSAG
jgi:hypothetical protein